MGCLLKGILNFGAGGWDAFSGVMASSSKPTAAATLASEKKIAASKGWEAFSNK
jgi:hypothetical protein